LCTKSAKQAINEELQGTVATYARWGGIFDIHLTTNLQKKSSSHFNYKFTKKSSSHIFKSVKI